MGTVFDKIEIAPPSRMAKSTVFGDACWPTHIFLFVISFLYLLLHHGGQWSGFYFHVFSPLDLSVRIFLEIQKYFLPLGSTGAVIVSFAHVSLLYSALCSHSV